MGRLDPRRARDADGERLVRDPVVRHDDRARPQPPERRRAVERERDDGVVDRHRGDRQVVALRVSHEDADLTGPKLDAAHVERVGRRRAAPEEIDDAVADRDDERHGEREADERDECPEPPGEPPGRLGARLHQPSSTWK